MRGGGGAGLANRRRIASSAGRRHAAVFAGAAPVTALSVDLASAAVGIDRHGLDDAAAGAAFWVLAVVWGRSRFARLLLAAPSSGRISGLAATGSRCALVGAVTAIGTVAERSSVGFGASKFVDGSHCYPHYCAGTLHGHRPSFSWWLVFALCVR